MYTSKYMKASRMLGDQQALAWIMKSQLSLGAKDFAKPKPFVAESQGTSILFLPCAIYNWTPPEGAGQFHGMPLNVKVILETFQSWSLQHLLLDWVFRQFPFSFFCVYFPLFMKHIYIYI